jgi:hypothetical protein
MQQFPVNLRIRSGKRENTMNSPRCLFLFRNFGKRAIKDPFNWREQSAIWKTANSSRIAEIGAPDIYPDDDGNYAIGLDGPAFTTRRFAEAVRLRTRHQARWLRQ